MGAVRLAVAGSAPSVSSYRLCFRRLPFTAHAAPMRCTLVLVLTLLVLTQTKPHKPTLNLTSFEEFYDTPATTLANFTLVSDCILRNDNVGLNVAPEMCWNGRQMYVRCPSRMKKGVYDLDDYEGFRTVLTPEKVPCPLPLSTF